MRDTTRQPVVRAILSLAWPAAASFLLHNLYHVNDTFFLGRVSADATNAMGLFMYVSIANFGFVLTLARGTQSLVGRRLGAGQREGCQLALAQGLRMAAVVLVPLGLLEFLFVPQILAAVGGTGATITEGTAYVRTLVLFLPFLFAQPIVEFSYQALGDTRTPVKLQLLAVAVNTTLNWILVWPHDWTLGPDGRLVLHEVLGDVELSLPWLSVLAPDGASLSFGGLGVAGAAAATGASRLAGASIGLLLLVRRFGMGRLVERSSYRADRKVAREILRVGIPPGSSTFLFAAVGFFVTDVVGAIDQNALGGYAIGFRGVESLSFMVVLGFGVATGTVTAHAVGAGDIARARRSGHVGTLLCCLLMAVTTTLFLLVPEQLVGVYSDDAAILEMAATYIAFMAWCQVPQALEMVYGDAMAGAGSSLRAALVSIPGNVLRIPLIWLLAIGLELGLDGVWLAIVASALLKGAGMTLLFASGTWEKAMHRGRAAVETG